MATLSNQQLLRHMPTIHQYANEFKNLGDWWKKVTLIGKINSGKVPITLIENMEGTKNQFAELQEELLQHLVQERKRKLHRELASLSQMAIDILIRNLFERTADVGFLATDDDIRTFLSLHEPSPEAIAHIEQRLVEYTRKYSVYDEIIILSRTGRVCAHLDATNPISHSKDPLIKTTLENSAPYTETFRHSDLQPERDVSLIYSAPIQKSAKPGAEVLGILCLCFRFDDEMAGIFANLARSNEQIAILDAQNRVIASNDDQRLPCSLTLDTQPNAGLRQITINGMENLAVTSLTKGYQGYFGLSWRGHAMHPVGSAFGAESSSISVDRQLLKQSRSISRDLLDIHRRSTLVTDDLGLIVLNGQIISAKRDAQEFMPVLDEIRSIGHRTRDIFVDSIADLYNTIVSSQLDAVQFHAFLAVDIMDRNLYERANDVRWWALTTRFREILGQPRQSTDDIKTLEEILSYINDLYTVYTNLLVFDRAGKILAMSNPNENALLGSHIGDQGFIQAALENLDSQRYLVSPFAASNLYQGRHTYVYATSIQSPAGDSLVGGIAIVFDAEPQFHAMLQDALPLDDTGKAIDGAFGLYCYPDGRVIASTLPELTPGAHFDLYPEFAALGNGERAGLIAQYQGHTYVAGAVMSQGYREYKTTNDYSNDVIGLVYMPL